MRLIFYKEATVRNSSLLCSFFSWNHCKWNQQLLWDFNIPDYYYAKYKTITQNYIYIYIKSQTKIKTMFTVSRKPGLLSEKSNVFKGSNWIRVDFACWIFSTSFQHHNFLKIVCWFFYFIYVLNHFQEFKKAWFLHTSNFY